jgi:hypothetical protein
VTGIASLGLSIAVFGPASWTAWLDGMKLIGAVVESGVAPVEKMVTPFALLHQLGVPASGALTIQVVIASATAAVVYRIWRLTDDIRLRGPAVVLGTFLATPYAMDYDLAILAFAIAWLAILGIDEGWKSGESNLLVMAWLLPAVAAPIAAATHVVLTPFVLGALLGHVWFRARRSTRRSAFHHVPRVGMR